MFDGNAHFQRAIALPGHPTLRRMTRTCATPARKHVFSRRSASLIALTLTLTHTFTHTYTCAAATDVLPDAEITVQYQTQGDVRSWTLLATTAAFGPVLASASKSLSLVLTPTDTHTLTPGFGCDSLPAVPADGAAYAYVIPRGNCSFTSKALNAQAAGAAAVIVYDNVLNSYFRASGNSSGNGGNGGGTQPLAAKDTCSYWCPWGEGAVTAQEVSPALAYGGYPGLCGACGSNYCVLTQRAAAVNGDRQICCAIADAMIMGSSGPDTELVRIPALFVALGDGMRLQTILTQSTVAGVRVAMSTSAPARLNNRATMRGAAQAAGSGVTRLEQQSGASASIGARPVPRVQPSAVLMWALGCFAVILASWYSATFERRLAAARAAGDATPVLQERQEAIEQGRVAPPVALSMWQVAGLIATSVTVLLALFFMLRAGVPIVLIITPLYFIACASSLFTVIFHPLTTKLAPALQVRQAFTLPAMLGGTAFSLGHVVAAALSLVLPITWIVVRKELWSWVLQDFLGIVLCCLFLYQLKLRTLRAITLLFSAFLVYDVVMVFLTPYMFGRSVMVDVATAGVPAGNTACFCRENPTDASCGPTDFLPLLLRLPRFGDYRGGFAMLGLGDIIVPGLLLSFAICFDLTKRRHFSRYWLVAVAGYCAGLGLANLAVQLWTSQPALLYLCPCTLAAVGGVAIWKGDAKDMWTGPRDDLEALSVTLRQDGGEAEHEDTPLNARHAHPGDGNDDCGRSSHMQDAGNVSPLYAGGTTSNTAIGIEAERVAGGQVGTVGSGPRVHE